MSRDEIKIVKLLKEYNGELIEFKKEIHNGTSFNISVFKIGDKKKYCAVEDTKYIEDTLCFIRDALDDMQKDQDEDFNEFWENYKNSRNIIKA